MPSAQTVIKVVRKSNLSTEKKVEGRILVFFFASANLRRIFYILTLCYEVHLN